MVSALQVKKDIEKFYLKKEGVSGLGVDKGKIIFYLSGPVYVDVPENISGYLTEIRYIGEVSSKPLWYEDLEGLYNESKIIYNRSVRWDPFVGGASGANEKVEAGTLGGIVYDKYGTPFILSNNHVLCNVNTKNQINSPIGAAIIQPSIADSGSIFDTIGRLHQYVPIDTEDTNLCDCAIASLDENTTYSDYVIGKYDNEFMRISGVSVVNIGDKVKKYGRTTGYTEGKVENIDFSTLSSYDNSEAIFVDQILVDIEADEGDSGSLLLDKNNNVVGLIFATCNIEGKSYAIANKIRNVLASLDIDFYEGDSISTPTTVPSVIAKSGVGIFILYFAYKLLNRRS